MSRSSRCTRVCLVAAALAGATQLLRSPVEPQVSFVQLPRREAAAAVAAALLAAAGQSQPAVAGPKFSVFGFGEGTSDAYNQIDRDAISPYSQFGNEKNAIYKKGSPEFVAKKKESLNESFKRIAEIPELIKTKQSERIKTALTLQTYVMRANMEYLSTSSDLSDLYLSNPALSKARAFFQDVADLGVFAKQKNWPAAQASYDTAQAKLAEWKQMVSY